MIRRVARILAIATATGLDRAAARAADHATVVAAVPVLQVAHAIRTDMRRLRLLETTT
jgi:hypothetical protein